MSSSVSCTPGENFAKLSSTPSLKKKARSRWRRTSCGDGRLAYTQDHDLALGLLREHDRGTADERGIAHSLDQSRAAPALPAARFQLQENLDCRSDFLRGACGGKRNRAVFFQPVPLAAQLFQLLAAKRLAQQQIRIARRIEQGAAMRLQHARTQAVA